MGSGAVGNYRGTSGAISTYAKQNPQIIKNKASLFSRKGTVTFKSISEHREKFLGKNPKQMTKLLRKHGYDIYEKPSIHKNSNAKILIIKNQSKTKNISQIQISKGSKRHGDIPYIKISTTNIGKIKIINGKKSQYKSDNKETAKIIFRRYYK